MKNIVVVLILGLCTMVMNAQEQEDMRTFDPEFAHTVYFWFHEPDNASHSALFEKSLKTFLKDSKYAKTNFIGKPPKATRDVVDGSFTYSLIVTFASAKAQQKYQEEAAHLRFVAECKDLWSKVIVYDSKGIKP